jgi:hypothetical protein
MNTSLLRTACLSALLALALAACDAVEPEQSAQTFGYETLEQGSSLFSPNTPANARGKNAQPALQNYGCYVSSPNLVKPEDPAYRLDAVVVTFPEEIVARAAGEHRLVIIEIGSSTLYAETPRPVPAALRLARCVVPDDEEAIDLLTESLVHFDADSARSWEGVAMSEAAQQKLGGSGARGKAVSSCFQVFVQLPVGCTVIGGNEMCEPPEFSATTVCVDTDEDDGDTGYDPTPYEAPTGGGSGGLGQTPDACDGDGIVPPSDQEGLGCEEAYRQAAWGKVVKMLNNIRKAIDAGDDLSDLNTWKKLLAEEWDTVAGCAAGIASGGAVASEMINCVLDLVVGFKGDDLIGLAKTVGKFDELLDLAKGTPMFRYLAESV